MLIAFNKPYGVLSQFTTDGDKPTLADFIDIPDVYPAGRLDHDSEGLMLLTDDGALQAAIAAPAGALVKRYWAQVEGVPTQSVLDRFAEGIEIGEGAHRYRTKAAHAALLDPPRLDDRDPPIRVRAAIPTSWIEVAVGEGRNRQVRRMTAAIGHPTLRLLRVGIGPIDLFELGLAPGVSVSIKPDRLIAASKKLKLRTASGGTRGRSLSTGFRSRRYWE